MRLLRVLSLLIVATFGTIVLMRFAPGYFTDAREMDSQYASQARAALKVQQEQQGSLSQLTLHLVTGWLHGDMGQSRQYDVPVSSLISSRVYITARLIGSGIVCGWLIVLGVAVPLAGRRTGHGELVIAGVTAVLLAVPVGALAIACLLANIGGPFAVLTTLIIAREFKLVYRLVRRGRNAPHLLYARASGIPAHRMLLVHLIPPIAAELLNLAMVAFVTALSVVVPIEVVFDVPGLGQLAWSAAMNRDLPVLLAMTLFMAAGVALASMFADSQAQMEAAQ
jgi:peptide/nickel transport system permease protein